MRALVIVFTKAAGIVLSHCGKRQRRNQRVRQSPLVLGLARISPNEYIGARAGSSQINISSRRRGYRRRRSPSSLASGKTFLANPTSARNRNSAAATATTIPRIRPPPYITSGRARNHHHAAPSRTATSNPTSGTRCERRNSEPNTSEKRLRSLAVRRRRGMGDNLQRASRLNSL